MIDGVTFKVGAQSHTLRLTTMAMVRLERSTGLKTHELMDDLKTGVSVEFVSHAFAAGLNDGKGMDMEDAAEIMDELGGAFGGPMQIALDAFTLALPQPVESPEGGDAEKPKGKSAAGKRKPVPKT